MESPALIGGVTPVAKTATSGMVARSAYGMDGRPDSGIVEWRAVSGTFARSPRGRQAQPKRPSSASLEGLLGLKNSAFAVGALHHRRGGSSDLLLVVHVIGTQ